MIKVKALTKQFGGLKAVNGATLSIRENSITGLIGPNGAGKTTLFNVIAGLFAPTSGAVFLDGENITGLPPHKLFAKGVLRTFQIPREFPTLSVLENLMVVPPRQEGENLFAAWFQRAAVRKREAEIFDKAIDVLGFLNLGELRDQPAGNLSGGQKKLLELGRTMMTEPKIVLLDEVGAGVNRTLLAEIGDAILRLKEERGYTFCMIEHDMEFIARLCHPVIVMAEGAVLAEGSAKEVRENEQVIEAYLGAKHNRAHRENAKGENANRDKASGKKANRENSGKKGA